MLRGLNNYGNKTDPGDRLKFTITDKKLQLCDNV